MNTFFRLAVGALLGASCVGSAFAQTSIQSYDPSAPRTRSEVVADLNDWFAAGYKPTQWIYYPDNAQTAGRIVAQRRASSVAPVQ